MAWVDHLFGDSEYPRFLLFCFTPLVLLLGVQQVAKAYKMRKSLSHIPTVGRSGWIVEYFTALRFMVDPLSLCQEGYAKFKGKPYKIPFVNGWLVFINNTDMINEFTALSDETLSIYKGWDQLLHMTYTISPDVVSSPYHIGVIRDTLTRNITACYADFYDEVMMAVKDEIPLETDWVEVKALKTMVNIFARSTNRLLVGYPLCRNSDYLDLAKGFATTVILNGTILNLFPKILHPIVGQIFSARRRSLRRIMKHLRPTFELRTRMRDQYGKDWPDKPNDYISWLIDDPHAQDWQRKSLPDLSARVLTANFVGVQTASLFTNILYYLAAHTDIHEPLRAEVEASLERNGWTNTAMREMHLMESFIKEVARLSSGAYISVRHVARDFSFSDGTTIPAGTLISLGAFTRHHDEVIYPSNVKFDPYRFLDESSTEAEGSIKHGLTSPTSDWLFFGSGRHACPGRLFVATALKTVLAHLIINYDVKMKDDGGVPPCNVFAGIVTSNVTAKVMFRKRRV